MTRLTDRERREVAGQSAEQRYQYFIDRAVESGQVWSLRSDDGWVEVSSEDGEPCMPVWPHPDFAAEWATDGWADCQPAAIDLDAWLSRWTPGLESDGVMLVVFPGLDEEGMVLPASELGEALLAAREGV
jgi:hypothetical protein